MTAHTVHLPLNQQQRELLERTVAQGLAVDLPALVRRALREYRPPAAAPAKAPSEPAR